MANGDFPRDTPAIKPDGRFETVWYLFFERLGKRNQKQPKAQTLTASPCVLVADDKGFYTVSGGTVSAIEIQRNLASYVNYGVVAGPFPVQQGDSFRITYTVAPTVTFLGG